MLIDKQTPVVLLLVLLLVLLDFNFLLEFYAADLPRIEKNVIIVFAERQIHSIHFGLSVTLEVDAFGERWPSFLFQ